LYWDWENEKRKKCTLFVKEDRLRAATHKLGGMRILGGNMVAFEMQELIAKVYVFPP
jgi:hypothetical protein